MPFSQSIASVISIRMPIFIITIPAIPTHFTQFLSLSRISAVSLDSNLYKQQLMLESAVKRRRTVSNILTLVRQMAITRGSCPGYLIDHVTALACGGDDAPSNMQWQSVAEGKAKDKWERKGCQVGSTVNFLYLGKSPYLVTGSRPASSNSVYFSGSRGGCFTYTTSGNKRYVAHSFCGQ